jgi:alkylation response protein AidB-like acyl-CoA dehydrogenase
MDFAWSDAEDAAYRRISREIADSLAPLVAARGLDRPFERREWRRCGEIGLLGLPVARELGGRGLGCASTARMMEAFGESCEDMGLVFAVGAHLFGCVVPVLEHADEPTRRRLLPRLCAGEWVGANAITEVEAGSDVFSLRTRAARDGDAYVLEGEKSFVTNGPVADLFVVYAATQPQHGFLGLTAFAIERDTPGLVLGEPFDKMGLDSVPSSALRLEACRVPASHRLGAEGQGGVIFARAMLWERTCLLAGYLGMMQRQLAQVVAHARTRKQFGRRIGKHEAVSHRVAGMKLRVEASRLLLYRACWSVDHGLDATLDASLAKLAVSEAALQSSLDAIQIFGGLGYHSHVGIERGLRDSVGATIASGTSEMMREIIARELGM